MKAIVSPAITLFRIDGIGRCTNHCKKFTMPFGTLLLRLLFAISITQISGCANHKKPESHLAAITHQIYSYDKLAVEYKETGNTEMAQYNKKMADEAREEYKRETKDPVDIIIESMFDNFLDLLFD